MNRRDSGPARPAGGDADDVYLEAHAYPVDPGFHGFGGDPRPSDAPVNAMRSHPDRPAPQDPLSRPWQSPDTVSPANATPGVGHPRPTGAWARATGGWARPRGTGRFRAAQAQAQSPFPPNGSSPSQTAPPSPPDSNRPQYGPDSNFDVFAVRSQQHPAPAPGTGPGRGNGTAPHGNGAPGRAPYGPPGAEFDRDAPFPPGQQQPPGPQQWAGQQGGQRQAQQPGQQQAPGTYPYGGRPAPGQGPRGAGAPQGPGARPADPRQHGPQPAQQAPGQQWQAPGTHRGPAGPGHYGQGQQMPGAGAGQFGAGHYGPGQQPGQQGAAPRHPGQPGAGQPGAGQPGGRAPGPGQHPYGAPPGYGNPRPGQPGQFRPAQPGNGPAGPGQAAPGQPGPGQHPYGRPAPGPYRPGPAGPGQPRPGQFAPGQPGQRQFGQGQQAGLGQHPYASPPGAVPGGGRLGDPAAVQGGTQPNQGGRIITQRDSALPDRGLGDGTGPIAAIETDNIAAFARDLRVMRSKAGMDYPEMAEKSHYTMRTLASAAGGLRLPTLPVLIAYVTACGGEQTEWEERWGKLMKATGDQAALPASGKDARTSGMSAPQAQPSPPRPSTSAPAKSDEVYVITSAPSRDEHW